jgi:RNA polymerase sigma-70 factor (ECF subfamily)
MNIADQDTLLYRTEKEQATQRDLQLASATLAGESDAFAELQRLYSGRIYSTIFRITRNREDAEDALQDTFLRAYQALHGFEGRSSFYSWLTRIAINSSLMILRKRRTRPEMPFDSSSEAENEIPQFELKDPGLNPEQIYDQRQRCANIRCAIQTLHSSLRGPLQARMTHGSSLEEIARTLDISEAAVKSRLYRARVRLSSARVFRNSEEKQHASSSLQRNGLIAGFQNREQPCMNPNR